ncbi:molybdate ABC transporter substrate-binding protein [Calidifontibacter sp. DB0510]|uniref:Molybdate ABC transporter substrate-binding protein n=1 Tax=Metallococcus carri TaxID=1656884 RepID=A0A967B4P5_9MICO|nr:molybdate ABC transporter substrate-binding protein [Metallococcus carri]NHN55572.1 molybdate ABC transporter substrate-binding protein [Metallococcus carri]NOP38244.1 molybdate ABC transporter substrate-binding protein [Calidifontibacter sp. DB2511S]
MKRSVSAIAVALVVTASAGVSACGSSDASGKRGTITVLAASSLTEAFGQLKTSLERQNPGLTIKISYAASSTLVTQVNNGAPADVVALADTTSAQQLSTTSKKPTIFATNRLEIAVPPSNPGAVTGLASLAKASTSVVLCAKQVPCGRAADKVLTRAGIRPQVISYEANVKATLAKVRTGDADAAVVYATDVAAAGSAVKGVPIPAAQNTVTQLPIVQLTDSPDAALFVSAVTSASGRKTLQSFGFGMP